MKGDSDRCLVDAASLLFLSALCSCLLFICDCLFCVAFKSPSAQIRLKSRRHVWSLCPQSQCGRAGARCSCAVCAGRARLAGLACACLGVCRAPGESRARFPALQSTDEIESPATARAFLKQTCVAVDRLGGKNRNADHRRFILLAVSCAMNQNLTYGT